MLGGIMMYPLLFLGYVTTVIVFDKALVYFRYSRLPAALRQMVEALGFDWKAFRTELGQLPKGNFYLRFLGVIYENRTRPAWWVESRAGHEARLIEKDLNKNNWVLETTVTAAPLIGLLGTIIGMMSSFKIVGASGLLKPEEVTGGVAQALIATACGLFIALIALFCFNYFSKKTAEIMDELERLGTCIIDHIRLDQHP